MTQEKRDPIPPGFYYVDLLTESNRDMYSHWIRTVNKMADSPAGGRVKDVRNEGTWKLFQVVKQVPRWGDSAGLGFPTIAPYGEKTALDDVIESPEVDTIDLDDLQNLAEQTPKAAGLVIGLAAVNALAIPVTIAGVIIWGITRLLK